MPRLYQQPGSITRKTRSYWRCPIGLHHGRRWHRGGSIGAANALASRLRLPPGFVKPRKVFWIVIYADEGKGCGLITVCIITTLQTVVTGEVDSHGKIRPQRTPSTIINRTVPRRAPNSRLRPREYLTEKEIERLQDAARKRSRYGHRDATMILVTYRHGLRASEVCGLRWDQVELDSGRLHVRRAKGGIDNVHPLSGREIRALRQLRRENMESRYVFITERGGPATTAGFLKTITRTGEAAKLPFPVHPHMLRHATGYALANTGLDTRALQHYMGHNNILHTVKYTEMAPDRFKNFWKD